MMRDAKRRRQSYRGIHTARKSYTEVCELLIIYIYIYADGNVS